MKTIWRCCGWIIVDSSDLLRPLTLGPYTLANNLVLAPMAGVSDLPWRSLCRQWGAGYAVGEMLHSRPDLLGTAKSRTRVAQIQEASPVSVQLLGNDPQEMAQAARRQVDAGAQVIDINMGCPAKKVCAKAAGSALLADERLVDGILRAVVAAVPEVPVTLKIRTGVSPDQRNAVRIARLAEDAGIALLTVHGRTRADKFMGQAEYDTIAQVVSAVSLPVLANGDIATPEQAASVLRQTGADGVMIGRAANGRPWLFAQMAHFLRTGQSLSPPDTHTIHQFIHSHLMAMHAFYGEVQGVRMARKHISWYADPLGLAVGQRRAWLSAETPQAQQLFLSSFVV